MNTAKTSGLPKPLTEKRSGRRSLVAALSDRLAERRHYAGWWGWWGWFLGSYSRLIAGRRSLPWPGRYRAVRIRFASSEAPVLVRLGTTDIHAAFEVFVHGEYELALQAVGESARQVLDLGANAGYASRRFLQQWPHAYVTAVEAMPRNAALCRRNLETLPRGAKVELVARAGVARRRELYLDDSAGEWTARITETPPSSSSPMIECVTVEELLTHFEHDTVDLLKCDVEGAERELFEDCRAWIGRIRVMVVEVHGEYRSEDLVADIERNGGRFAHEVVAKGPNHAVVLLRASPA